MCLPNISAVSYAHRVRKPPNFLFHSYSCQPGCHLDPLLACSSPKQRSYLCAWTDQCALLELRKFITHFLCHCVCHFTDTVDILNCIYMHMISVLTKSLLKIPCMILKDLACFVMMKQGVAKGVSSEPGDQDLTPILLASVLCHVHKWFLGPLWSSLLANRVILRCPSCDWVVHGVNHLVYVCKWQVSYLHRAC